jgi:hypothetical protein
VLGRAAGFKTIAQQTTSPFIRYPIMGLQRDESLCPPEAPQPKQKTKKWAVSIMDTAQGRKFKSAGFAINPAGLEL